MKHFKLLPTIAATVITAAATFTAGAVEINFEGTTYEVETRTGSFLDNQSDLENNFWYQAADQVALDFAAELNSLGIEAFLLIDYQPTLNDTYPWYGILEAPSLGYVGDSVYDWGPNPPWDDDFDLGTFNIGWAVATAVPVPEPSTLALLGLGLAGVGFSRRRKV